MQQPDCPNGHGLTTRQPGFWAMQGVARGSDGFALTGKGIVMKVWTCRICGLARLFADDTEEVEAKAAPAPTIEPSLPKGSAAWLDQQLKRADGDRPAFASGDIGKALTESLGLAGRQVASIELRAASGDAVRLTVTEFVTRRQADRLAVELAKQRFRLVPLGPAAVSPAASEPAEDVWRGDASTSTIADVLRELRAIRALLESQRAASR